MSDQIDLTNNLCVTEDAFEKFQSESVCDDDEFITLSDIVPQPQPTLDLTACLDEIQDDDCIVSGPDLQPNTNIVSVSTTKTNQQQQQLATTMHKPRESEIHSDITTGSTTEGTCVNMPQRTTKKVTRRKSTFISELRGSEDVIHVGSSVCSTPQGAPIYTLECTPTKSGTKRRITLLSDLPNVDNVVHSDLLVSSTPHDVSKETLQYTPPKKITRRKSALVNRVDDSEELIHSSSSSTINNSDVSDNTPTSTPIKGTLRKNSISINLNCSENVKTCDDNNQGSPLKMGTKDNSKVDKIDSNVLNNSELVSTRKSKRRILMRKQSPELPVKKQTKTSIQTDNTNQRKRGRPKKINSSTEELSASKLDTNITVQEPESQQTQDDANNLLEKLPNEPARRIRRTKSLAVFKDNDKIEESLNSSTDFSVTDTGKPQRKKPGRRPKQNKSNKIETTSKKSSSNVNSKTTKKNASEKKLVDQKYDKIERELERILSTPTNIPEDNSDNTQGNNDQESNTNQSVIKKRGRPKKQEKESTQEKLEQKPEEKQEESSNKIEQEDDDDETDDMCLSSLKKQLSPEDELKETLTLNVCNEEEMKEKHIINDLKEILEDDTEQAPKICDVDKPSTFIDTIVTESAEMNSTEENVTVSNEPEIESPSKRPVRRKAKKVFHYDEGSDEDPFANVELSDDDLTGRKGRYYSDDEYIPGKRKKGKAYSESSMSESDEFENLEEVISKKQIYRKKGRKSDEAYPHKRSKKLEQNTIADVTSTAADTTTQNDDDLERSLQSPDITTNESSNQTLQAWGTSHEFENFIVKKIQGTNLQIKKLSGTTPQQTAITPLEIPVLDPNEPKKTVEICTQTNAVTTKTVEVQTTAPYESKMKTKVPLTAEQSVKACEFLKGIVKTTSDLGQLMIQKSEDFIQKKINTKNVTDTTKMDYCVQKSFLLFKLAKHNLIQMEEDLANEYERFLRTNDMLQYQESPKCITATPKPVSSDSDCEIVEEPVPENKKEKSKFNLKTVFLNKELSIKIAKKSNEEPQTNKEKLNIKGRHTVWINDSIMVKKVKPTQSFLAQDSRNKKPPDTYVTAEMVKDFFDNYYKRQQILSACAPFVSPEWLNMRQICTCNYFIAQLNDISTAHSPVLFMPQPDPQASNSIVNRTKNHMLQPLSLQILCTKVLQKCMYEPTKFQEYSCDKNTKQLRQEQKYQPKTLLRMSLCVISKTLAKNDQCKVTEKTQSQDCQKTDGVRSANSLKALCLDSMNKFIYEPTLLSGDSSSTSSVPYVEEDMLQHNSLKALCLDSVNKFIYETTLLTGNSSSTSSAAYVDQDMLEYKLAERPFKSNLTSNKEKNKNLKTLFSLCVELIQHIQLSQGNDDHFKFDKKLTCLNKIKSLKSIALENVKNFIYKDFYSPNKVNILNETTEPANTEICSENEYFSDNIEETMALTIKSVNTLSDDIFSKIPNALHDNSSSPENDDSNYSDYDHYEPDYEECNQHNNCIEDSNWVSKVQLQELRSCLDSVDDKRSKTPMTCMDSNEGFVSAQIKVEPLEETAENVDDSIVKNEPVENYNDIVNFTPLITKVENTDRSVDNEDIITQRNSTSYDEDAFETFASTNKLLQLASDYSVGNDEVFSQSALRVRRQHEPDMDDDFDTDMGLLIPQQTVELAKGRLMESSSDEGTDVQKNSTKKKRKVKPKNTRQKNKDISTNKDKNTVENAVAILTRKMQEKIRQEEKKDESSDSELESSLALRLGNYKKALSEKEKSKTNKDSELENSLSLQLGNYNKAVSENEKSKTNKEVDNQIQCNDVDSTENINNSILNEGKEKIKENKVSNTKRKKSKGNNLLGISNSIDEDAFVMQPDAPVELLECEPTLPMLHDDDMDNMEMDSGHHQSPPPDVRTSPEPLPYTERHGWKCFQVNNNDTKLYEHAYIQLEKLPESFVETYFKYQGMASKNKHDTDVDRLTNLNTLHRNLSKDNKLKSKTNKVLLNGQLKSKDTESCSAPGSPANDDHCNEFSPSEDEGANIDDEVAPPAPHQDATENAMAKNSLMNDPESDSEKPSNTEDIEKPKKTGKKKKDEESHTITTRSGPKSKYKGIKEIDSLMLTADKMMNKELALLHAPVSLNENDPDVKDTPKKSTKSSCKSASKQQGHLERAKLDEDSSSEEEKQWVTTKEKLLKRLEKKQDNPSVDDAKRAKIVSEFIERRGDAPEIRTRGRARSRRSSKKFLERQKQMSVLKRELFGEADASYKGKKHSQAFGKGRKNIRKVIDKKSLARSTVVANMEEFERKRRLNMQQTKLREQLGCEEGVSVLVINDEVCLEYDFEQMCPVVTVHPFFTKVMKAHQYEGVKFMWDACFESLSQMEAGHPGGGCILAHCMGLGKTLQVLALLHTVLTHPRVGMQRVLVCCPLSTVLNWVDEIHKWIGPVTNKIKQHKLRRKLQVFELSKLKKTYERAYQLEDWYNGGGIFIIGYELFRSLTTLDPVLDDIRPTIVNKIRHALLDPGPDVVICDEGHLLKNDSSVLAVAMSRVATRRRIVLTGTPMQNNLREYYCMVNFVKPSLLGTYSEYSNRFENPIMNGQHRDSLEEDIKLMKARTHILHKVLEGCLQRQEASVLYPYLPKKHEYTVFIPPTACQWELYKHYIMTYALPQQQKQKQSVLKDFHVLQKIWTHPQVLHNFLMKDRDERNKIKVEKLEDDLAQEDLAASEDVKPSQTEVWWLQYLAGGDMLESLESSNKFLVVFQLLEECIALGDKILIFSTSLYTLDALEYFLKRINKWSLGQEYYRLDGSVPAEVRQKWCREFNAEHNVNTKLFLISTRAGCLGLNMTAANRVIILDTSWNPAHDIQSIFRVYRFGQKKDCYIYRLVAMGTMEQKIYERAVTKQAVACRVVDEQQIDRHYNMAELTELYRFDEEGLSVEAGLAAGVADVALLRVAARARLHAVREHDSLLRGSREQHLPEHERNAAWMQFQQEHSTPHHLSEIQNRLTEASEGIQKLLEKDMATPSGSVEIKTEIGEEQIIKPMPGLKGKKGKKGATVSSALPVQEPNIKQQKDFFLDAEREKAKVKKIMDLLIKHQFHTRKQTQDIPQLVANVRRIVDAGGAGLNDSDELTRSIATVMMQEDEIVPTVETTTTETETTQRPDADYITSDLNDTPSQEEVEVKQEELKEPNENDSDDSNDLLVPIRERIVKPLGRPRKRPIGRPRKVQVLNTEQCSQKETNNEVLSILRTRLQKSSDIRDRTSSKKSSPAIKAPVNELERKPNLKYGSEINLVDDDDDDDHDTTCRDDAVVEIDWSEEVSENQKEKSNKSAKKNSKANVVNKPAEIKKSGKTRRKAALAAAENLEKLDDDCVVTLDDDDDDWVDDRQRGYTSIGKIAPANNTTVEDNSKTAHTVNTESTSRKVAKKTVKRQEDPGDNSIILSDDEDSDSNQKPVNKEPEKAKKPEDLVPLHPSMLSNSNFIKIVAYAYQSNRMLDEDAALLAAQYSTQKALKEIEATGKDIISGPLYDIAVKVLGYDVLKKLHKKSKTKTKKKDDVLPPAPVTDTKEVTEDSSKRNLKPSTRKTDKAQKDFYEVEITGSRVESVLHKRKTDKAQKDFYEVEITGNRVESVLHKRKTEKVQKDVYEVEITGNRVEPVLHKRKTERAQKVYDVEITGNRVESILPNDMPEQSNDVEIVASTSQASNVVPVGMFKGSVSMKHTTSQMVEECILPDDDAILGSNNETSRIYKKPNSQPFIITSVSSKRPIAYSRPMPEPIAPDLPPPPLIPLQPQGYLTISEGKLVMPHQSNAVTASNVTPVESKKKSSVNDDTICLDSDEEEAVSSQVSAVGSTSQAPAIIPTVSSSMINQTQMPLLSTVQGIPLLLRLKDTQTTNFASDSPEIQLINSQQSNFIIVPPLQDKLGPKINGTVSVNPSQQASSSNVNVNQRDSPQPTAKKVCKPGDIVRVTPKGDLEVLTRLEKLPNNVKPKPLNKSVMPLVDLNAIKQKAKQTIMEKVKLPGLVPTSTSVNDPLSILKDVVHIQAGEYEKSARKAPSKTDEIKLDRNKSANTELILLKTEAKKLSYREVPKSKSEVKTSIKIPYVKEMSDKQQPSIKTKHKSGMSSHQQSSTLTLKKAVSRVTQSPTEKPKSTERPKLAERPKFTEGPKLTVWPKPTERSKLAERPKPTEGPKLAEKPKPTSSVVVGSSKDIILRAKSSGGPFLKTTSSSNVRSENIKMPASVPKQGVSKPIDVKKRVLPWPEDKTAKKTKKPMTLKDFNLDDIDDIIELE
ncbi:uncharacterized protein [Epargyreus clarus]|uniref:uncharacterized protein isoform X2 n=1 Tax=Epargyreus clarus TaxID=520877 RepID=UPI003C2E56F4